MRSRWLLVLAVASAILGGASIYSYLRGLDRRVPVVVAARDLRPRRRIELQDLRVAYLHPDGRGPGTFSSPAEAAGRWVIREILAGEQVTTLRTDLALVEHAAYGLDAGERAMFLPGDFARLAGAVVHPGDRVDLVAVTAGRGEPVAYRLAVSLRVLDLRDDRGLPFAHDQAQSSLGGALLAVPDQLIESVALAMASGQVYMALCNPLAELPADPAGSAP